jgi:hypothetical protein
VLIDSDLWGGPANMTKVKEFLLNSSNTLSQQDDRIASCLIPDPNSAHTLMALTCGELFWKAVAAASNTFFFTVTQLLSKGLFNIPYDDKDGMCKPSPYYYSVVHWILHAAEVTPGRQSTPNSGELWKTVDTFFWGNESNTFRQWLKIFPERETLHDVPSRKAMGWEKYNMLFYQPLHIAASYGLVDTIRTAIARKENLNARDENGWTPLLHAICAANYLELELLLEQSEVDVNLASDSQDTPLMSALYLDDESSRLSIMEALLKKDEILLDGVDMWGNSALGLAVSHGSKDAIKMLKDRGASVSKYNGREIELRDGDS